MNHLSKCCIIFIIGIFISIPPFFIHATYITKVKIPVDPRPLPKTKKQWEKIQKESDPLAIDLPTKMTLSYFRATRKSTQSVPWNQLQWGDIVLGRGIGKNSVPYGYFRHAGMWHFQQKKIVSAMPKEGVCFQLPSAWNKDYPRLEFLTVTKLNPAAKQSITEYGARQLGKPYAFSSKQTATTWYCSKIPWACYKGKGIDLDRYGLFLVAPDSLYHSKYTQSIYRRLG